MCKGLTYCLILHCSLESRFGSGRADSFWIERVRGRVVFCKRFLLRKRTILLELHNGRSSANITVSPVMSAASAIRARERGEASIDSSDK